MRERALLEPSDLSAFLAGATATPLKAGTNNLGIIRHENEHSNSLTTIIEKRTKLESEIEILQKIMEKGISAFLPRIYEMRRQKDYCSFYMEHLAEVGRFPDDLGSASKQIARSLRDFNIELSQLNTSKAIRSRRNRMLRKLPEKIRPCIERGFIDEKAADKFLSMGNEFISSPYVFSHNDLYWPNLQFYSGACRFIDFGLSAPNAIGADFQRFSRASFKCDLHRNFCQIAFEEYADLTGENCRMIRSNSAFFAATKCLVVMGRLPKDVEECSVYAEKAIMNYLLDMACDR